MKASTQLIDEFGGCGISRFSPPATSRKYLTSLLTNTRLQFFGNHWRFLDNRSGRWPRVDASRPGKDRCVGSPLDIEISAKIPLRKFLLIVNTPSVVDCARLGWRSQLALVGNGVGCPRVEARPSDVSASAR